MWGVCRRACQQVPGRHQPSVVAWVPHHFAGLLRSAGPLHWEHPAVAITCQHIGVLRCFATCKQLSAKGARLHESNINAKGHHLVAEPLHIALQCVLLGCAVGQEEGWRDLPSQGGRIDDQTGFGCAQGWQHRLHGADGTEVFGLHLFLGLCDAEGLGNAQVHQPALLISTSTRTLLRMCSKAAATEASSVTSMSMTNT